jgi:hypothetical protein
VNNLGSVSGGYQAQLRPPPDMTQPMAQPQTTLPGAGGLQPSAPTGDTQDYSHLAQSPEEAAFIQRIVQAQQEGYGGVRPGQVEYYLQNLRQAKATGEKPPWLNDKTGKTIEDYYFERARGMGAGGADTATQGQYAGQDFGSLAYQQGGGDPMTLGNFSMGYQGGQYPLSSVQGPGFMAPFNAPFQAPTGTDDPGFDFAMSEGQKALERSATSRGTLLTGGTLKELAGYTTGMALQGYGDAWNRARTSYLDAANIFDRNRQFQSGLLGGIAGQGLSAANAYGGASADIAMGQGNAQAAGTATQGNIWGTAIPNLANTAAGTILSGHYLRNQQPNVPLSRAAQANQGRVTDFDQASYR